MFISFILFIYVCRPVYTARDEIFAITPKVWTAMNIINDLP